MPSQLSRAMSMDSAIPLQPPRQWRGSGRWDDCCERNPNFIAPIASIVLRGGSILKLPQKHRCGSCPRPQWHLRRSPLFGKLDIARLQTRSFGGDARCHHALNFADHRRGLASEFHCPPKPHEIDWLYPNFEIAAQQIQTISQFHEFANAGCRCGTRSSDSESRRTVASRIRP